MNRKEPPQSVSPMATMMTKKGTEMMIVVMLKPTAAKGFSPATNM